MSDGTPFYNPAAFPMMNPNPFPMGMNYGFSLGTLDPMAGGYKPMNMGPGGMMMPNMGVMEANKENMGHRKHQKFGNKPFNNKRRDNSQGRERDSQYERNYDDRSDNGDDSNISKASKHIRKNTFDKLKKKAMKNHEGFERQGDRRFNYQNNRNFNNRGGPHDMKGGLNSSMFRKTKICPHFMEGTCKRGDTCNFAHSQSEIKETPNLKKTKMCIQFQNTGHCNLGERCSFAHSEAELRSTPDFYKTSLCKAYEKGQCKSGDNCRYAHGDHELRSVPYSEKPSRHYQQRDYRDASNQQSGNNSMNFSNNPYNNGPQGGQQSAPTMDFGSALSPPKGNNVAPMNNMPAFGGFNMGFNLGGNVPQNTYDTSVSYVSNGNKQGEKAPTGQPSFNDDITFNTFNPEKFASFFNNNANRGGFN